VEEAILNLSMAAEGRMMALFTSYAQLTKTADKLRSFLEEAGFTLFVQGEGGSRQQLLAAFRQTERSVMFGTRSFWEGVDVQGEALSALIITRLPFAVPTDPIVSARSESFDSPFFQYSVPEAILHLRQGFGRLIRSKSDRGVCVLLDRRLTSKRYGSMFLESLPNATVQRGRLADMPAATHQWLEGRETGVNEPEPEMELNDYMPDEQPPVWFDSEDRPF
jgi:DNA polymerase-3 subunit epsilon/ATP-dependent DNA helicase DinG